MLLFPSSSMRASANTPAETTGACVARFPVAGSLPRYNGGSASASCFSRPARRLLAFSPAWSLNRLTRPFDARVLQSISLPPRTALAATNRSDSCCAGFAPARRKRLSTAHVVSHIISLGKSHIVSAVEAQDFQVDSLLQEGVEGVWADLGLGRVRRPRRIFSSRDGRRVVAWPGASDWGC